MISLKILFRKADCQKEFEDFTDESRQLEQELETTLIQNEKQIRDLNGMIISLRDDNESLRVRKLLIFSLIIW
jgi:TolA-binding protein